MTVIQVLEILNNAMENNNTSDLGDLQNQVSGWLMPDDEKSVLVSTIRNVENLIEENTSINDSFFP